ncbi:hypothetical protein FOBRF1_006882 [Fusarium oxysporum]
MSDFRIAINSDEAGFAYKAILAAELEAGRRAVNVIDVASGEADRTLLICGTGLGVAIAANKVKGIRAVTAHDGFSGECSVLSNNA